MEDRLFELGKQSKQICTRLNDDYCLVTKTMPSEDEQLEDYINNIRRAREAGINIAEIIDYRLMPETTQTFAQGKLHFTKGVFLERLAKGESNDYGFMVIKTAKDNDITEQVNTYIAALIRYVQRLTDRANMSQKQFNKFVDDCLKLEDYGITIDPKPLNFFFDKEEGVTIIDPIPFSKDERLIDNEHFPSYILVALYGYGRPTLYINDTDYSVITPELKARLITAYAEIDFKVSAALRKAGINAEIVRKNLNKYVSKYTFKRTATGNIMDYLLDGYFAEMEKDTTPEIDDHSVTENPDGTFSLNITV